jgi:YfiH family protein
MSKLEFKKDIKVINPNWATLPSVKAFTTTKSFGFSTKDNYEGLNLSISGRDDRYNATLNRKKLSQYIGHEPNWLKQNHTNKVIEINVENINCNADASFSFESNTVCSVLTADCVPILLTNKKASFVSAIHAGWKGLASNIIEKTIDKACRYNRFQRQDIIAWIGPCICSNCYSIRSDVMQKFISLDSRLYQCFNISDSSLKLDLVAISKILLEKSGVTDIYSSNICTKNPCNNLFSARRDGIHSGRIASCIWLENI